MGNGTTGGNQLTAARVVDPSDPTGYLTNVVAVAAGTYHSLALKRDGTVRSWGYNGYGQLGNGTSTSEPSVVTVIGLSGIVAVAGGGYFSMALGANGTVYAWGDNGYGELGADPFGYQKCNGDNGCSSSPVIVPVSAATAIAAGTYFALAVGTDQTVWGWGYDYQGQVGPCGGINSYCPFEAWGPIHIPDTTGSGNLGNVVSVAAGDQHSIAVKSDGTVYTWGGNPYGQLGIGTSDSNPHPTPTQVTGIGGNGFSSTATTPAGGYDHTLMVTSDGNVWAWGDNVYGDLGNGDDQDTQQDSPVHVCAPGSVPPGCSNGYISGVAVIAAGHWFSLATSAALVVAAAPFGSACYPPMLALCGADGGDPVNPLSGSYAYTKVDVAIPGRGPSPLFSRSYNSSDTRVTALGPGWTHSYAIRLNDPGSSGSGPCVGAGNVLLVGPQGRTDCFTYANGSYNPPPGVSTQLAKNGDGTYTATLQDQTTWGFTADGRLSTITDRYGNMSTLSYNPYLQLTSVSDPAGRGSLSFAYNTNGQLTSVTDWQAPVRSVQFAYDSNGRLWKVTDRNGQTTTYGYDPTTGHLATIKDANQHTAITNAYDPTSGKVTSQQDALLNSTTFTYITNQDGSAQTTITYPTTSFDGSHPTAQFNYNAQGQLTSQVVTPSNSDPAATTAYTYDANGNLQTVTDPMGNVTTSCYDVDYTGNSITGSHGNLTRTIAPLPTGAVNQPVTLFKYDGKNNLLETIPPKGVSGGTGVTCQTNLSAAINTNDATDNTYDANGVDLLSTTRHYTDPDLGLQTAITTFVYGDPANPGRVTQVIPPRGNHESPVDYPTDYSTKLVYYTSTSSSPQAGMLASVTDPLGNETTYTYDPVGRKVSMVDPNGNVSGGNASAHQWNYAYDNEDRLTSASAPAPTTGGAALTTGYTYDSVGNRTVITDANGQLTRYSYDARDSLNEVDQSATQTDPNNDPNKIVTQYSYDNLGNLSEVLRNAGDPTQANEFETAYTYDGLNRLRSETQYPNGAGSSGTLVTNYTYDKDNNRHTLVDPVGKTTTFGYDQLNGLVSVGYSDNTTPNVSYGYDLNGNRTSMQDGTGQTTYTYDELDRPTAITSPGSSTVGYRYDLDGNRTKVIYPDNTAATYTFNAGSQLASLASWVSPSTTYSYYPDGSLEQTTNVDNTTAAYTYDNARRLIQVSNQNGSAIIDQHTYTLDAVGNRTKVQETLASAATSTGSQNPAAWGLNSSGQLGATSSGTCGASTACSLYPLAVLGSGGSGNLTGILAVSAGISHTVALRSDGTVWTWGDNSFGQLGNGTTGGSSASPSQVSSLSGIVAIAAGSYHSLALKSDGTIWAWGRNNSGQVGSNSPASAINSPAHVASTSGSGTLSGIGTIAVGASHSLAISSDGSTVYAWGLNTHGQLGTSTTGTCGANPCSPYPVTVGGLSGTIVGISGGGAHSLAVKSDGSAWAWGANASGQLGNNQTADSTMPVQVQTGSGGTLSGVVAVAGGQSFSLGLKSDGSVWAWGDNGTGELGQGTHDSNAHATASEVLGVGGSGYLNGVSGIAAGASFAVVAQGTGGVLAWGQGNSGQLGNNASVGKTTPVIVVGVNGTGQLGGQTLVAAGNADAFAIATTRTITTNYGYDHLYRLTSGGTPGTPNSYTYDPVGNRLTLTQGNAAAVSYAYDKADRLLSVGGQTYTIDNDGNLTADPNTTLTYDQANRLKTFAAGGTTTTYSYDGDGKRASKVVGSTTTTYAYDDNRSLPVVLTDGTLKYVWGNGLAYATTMSGTIRAVYHTDGLGSVRAITDANGNVTQTYQTDEFGVSSLTQGTSPQPYRYTGEQRDNESGFSYLRARYYVPTLGRFLTQDPVFGDAEAPLSLNRFSYAENSPATLTDLSGRSTDMSQGSSQGSASGGSMVLRDSKADNECVSTAGGLFGGYLVNALCADAPAGVQGYVLVTGPFGTVLIPTAFFAKTPGVGSGSGKDDPDLEALARQVAEAANGVVKGLKAGFQVDIPWSKSRRIVVRIMEYGGQRTSPYYRVGISGAQEFTRAGTASDILRETHMDITEIDAAYREIMYIISQIPPP